MSLTPAIALQYADQLPPVIKDELEQLVASIAQGFINLNNSLLGVGSGYRIARGQAITTAASTTVSTGLSTVVVALAALEDAPVIGCDRVQAFVGNQLGAPAAGLILLKGFRPTAAGDTTPIA